MAKLDDLFNGDAKAAEHPVVKYLRETFKPEQVRVGIHRPKDMLGFKPSKLMLFLTQNGNQLPPQEYAWDDDLNETLVKHGYRAIDEGNERMRFSLLLRWRFRRVETRFGEGFFNAVLVKYVKESQLMTFREIVDVMKDVFANQPHMHGHSYDDCRGMINQILQACASDLSKHLQYERTTAENMLAGALAFYLDERFTVSDRRRLGWT